MDLGSPDLTSPLDGKSGFLPVFRSGSCSEIGPKSYMEDEHVCIDNLVHYLGAPEGFPAPGAFYGVSYLLLRILVYLLIDCNVVTFFFERNCNGVTCYTF